MPTMLLLDTVRPEVGHHEAKLVIDMVLMMDPAAGAAIRDAMMSRAPGDRQPNHENRADPATKRAPIPAAVQEASSGSRMSSVTTSSTPRRQPGQGVDHQDQYQQHDRGQEASPRVRFLERGAAQAPTRLDR